MSAAEPTTATCCRCDGQYLDLPVDFTGDPLLLTLRLSNPCQCTIPARPVALRARDTTAKTMPIPNVPMEDLVFGDDARPEEEVFCWGCRGFGEVAIGVPCGECSGTGHPRGATP